MPNETLITEIENMLSQIVRLGGENERTSIVPNLTVIDANPSGLTGFVIVSDDRDGDNILAKKVGSVIYTNGDLVNVLFPKGGEAIAFQQGSQSSNSGIWEIVAGTSTDIIYDKGNVRISDELQHAGDIDTSIGFTNNQITLTTGTAIGLTLTGSDVTPIDALFGGTVTVPTNIIHDGDADTLIAFTTDKVQVNAGGLEMIAAIEAATDEVVINDAQGDINFRIEGDTQENLMLADAGLDVVIFGGDATKRIGTELVTIYNTTTDNATNITGLYVNANPNVASASGGVNYRGLQFNAQLDGSGGSTGDVIGIIGEGIYNQTSGTLARATAAAFNIRASNAGTITFGYGARAAPILTSSGGIGTFYEFQARTPTITGAGGITTCYGLYIEQLKVTGVTNSYGVRQVSSSDQNQFQGFTGFGTSGPTCQVHVDQASTTAAIPVIILDQADLSEEFIDFVTTVGAGNPVDTAAIGTYYGKARVAVNGTFKYVALYNS